MVVVKIIGGLGNQMFQYAFAKSLHLKGYEVKFDVSDFEHYKLHGGYQLDKYNIDLDISSECENNQYKQNTLFLRFLRKVGIFKISYIKEQSLLCNKKFLEICDNSFIEGYFQSERYFQDIRKVLLKQFSINDKNKISNYTNLIKKK